MGRIVIKINTTKSKHLFLFFSFILVPSGKPTITAAHNTSSTSIQLVWRPPSKTSINGEFLGYRIAYRPRNDNLSHQSTEMLLKDPEVTQFTILDLSPFTQYLVSLQVVNPAGLGPPTKVVVMTDEGGKLLSELWFSLHQQLGHAWYKINYSWKQALTPFYIKYHQLKRKNL